MDDRQDAHSHRRDPRNGNHNGCRCHCNCARGDPPYPFSGVCCRGEWGWFGDKAGHINAQLTLVLQCFTGLSWCHFVGLRTTGFWLQQPSLKEDPSSFCLREQFDVPAPTLLGLLYLLWWRRSAWQTLASIHGQGSEKYIGAVLLFVLNTALLLYLSRSSPNPKRIEWNGSGVQGQRG